MLYFFWVLKFVAGVYIPFFITSLSTMVERAPGEVVASRFNPFLEETDLQGFKEDVPMNRYRDHTADFINAFALCLLVTSALFSLLSYAGVARAQTEASDVALAVPKVALAGVPFELPVRATEPPQGPLELKVGENTYTVAPDDFSSVESGIVSEAAFEDVVVPSTGAFSMTLSQGGQTITEASSQAIYGWLSVLPALLAITIALVSRQVVPSLFFGVALGAWMTYGLSLAGIWFGLLDTMQVYVLEALVPPSGDKGHMSIVIFTLMMGGLIGIIYRNGGAHAIADRISSLASNRRRGQLSTSGLGFAIFFSTYANSLIVGNTMRPVTDRLKISREKLAYIVDCTAAPLAAIAIISTWIGFELGLIESAVATIGFSENAYSIFLKSIPYNFYPILALFFVLAVGFTGRDFGPMAKAERRAFHEGKVVRDGASVDDDSGGEEGEGDGGNELRMKEGVSKRSLNALLPIGTLIATVAVGLYVTGEGDTLRDIIGSAESNRVLVWAGLLGVLVAAVLSVGQRLLTIGETVNAWFAGLKSVLFVMIILTLAWSLAAIAVDLNTAGYLVSVLGDAIRPEFLPAILFVLSAAVSFAVGTSWGTMGILMPLAVPLVWTILQNFGMATPEYNHIVYATIGTILAGSVWGDHCSPISDTTIISSVAAGSDHIDHVRTQIPYALAVGFVSLIVGLIPTGFGLPWWLTLPASAAVLLGILYIFGDNIEAEAAEAEAEQGVSAEAASTD